MASLTTVRLNRGDSSSWGFRLQGGKDFGTPLVIQKVNGGSPAERAGLIAGDAVIKINNVDVYNLLHKEAQDVIVRSGSNFDMVIQRGGSTWKPSVVPTGTYPKPSPSINNVSAVTKTSLAANQRENIGAIGTGHNVAAKPFNTQVNGAVNGGPTLVNKQYNSPLKLYSEDAIAESLSAQTEVLSTGALGVNFKKNEKDYDATNSAVYRMLQEAENDKDGNDTEPDSGIVTAPNRGMAGLRHVEAPVNRPAPPNPQLPPGQNICADCERLIVGVFVRIKDKNLHVECFKCATCGSSLKNVGYYNINNKLYCDIHAKAAAIAINNPSAIPITISPGSKAPASAISAALSSHSYPSSPLSAKAPSYTPSYQPEELLGVSPAADDLSSLPNAPLTSLNSPPSAPSNIKPSSSALFNTSAPLSFSKYINKPSNFSGPKPFSSVSAPLSPGGTFPRAAPLSPQTNYNKAPLSPSAPSYGSYSPSSTGHCTNITWPPTQEDTEVPTACPLFYPPPSKVEAEIEKKLQIKKQSKFESEYFTEESELMDETMSFNSEELSFSGRRSTTECIEILSETLDTQKLVENTIRVSPQQILPPLNVGETTGIKSQSDSNWVTSCPISLPNMERCQEKGACDFKRPAEFEHNTTECQLTSKVENAVPQKWEGFLTQAARTVATDSSTFSRIPSRHSASPMASALVIAPAQPFSSVSHKNLEPVPFPEQTEPYFPPEHPIIPLEKTVKEENEKEEERLPIPKPYSPFTKALEIAPDRPFTPVGCKPAPSPVKKKPKDPLDKLLEELPKPAKKVDMRCALTTAPERPYTPQLTEYSATSSDKHQKTQHIDRSQLVKPLKPEELPASFKINVKEPKPPSYYAPSVIEERINSEHHESSTTSERKETKTVEKEILNAVEIGQPTVTTSQEPQTTNYAPMFQGFTCSFKNKTEHSQFSVEVCTTPPVLSPPPKPQIPISYIATVEQKPTIITREQVVQESTDRQQITTSQENIKYEAKVSKGETKGQKVQKQAEEIIQIKPLPVTALLRKAEALPSYQVDLQAAAESELRIMEKKRKAEERLQQQKREREQKLDQQQNIQQSQQEIEKMQSSGQVSQFSTLNTQQLQTQLAEHVPLKPETHHLTKPIITVEPSDTNNVTEKLDFQPVPYENPFTSTFSPRARSMTPSMIHKAPALLPYYQDNLVAHFHAPVSVSVLDPTTPDMSRSPTPHPPHLEMRSRSPSPFPTKASQDRAKSPAQGPPPNPLNTSSPLPTPQDSRLQQAKENLKTYIPEYKSHRDIMEINRGIDFNKSNDEIQQHTLSQVSQNVAYPTTYSKNQLSVQTGNVQQIVQSSEQQRLEAANIQKHETKIYNNGNVSSTIDISEKCNVEQLEASRQSQTQCTEKIADGLTQIQRKKVVTEEYEQSHKETNIQIEKNITSVTTKYPFTKVNVSAVEPPNVQSFHITDPHHVSRLKSRDGISSQDIDQRLDAQNVVQPSQEVSKTKPFKLSEPENQAQAPPESTITPQSQPVPPQPPTRRVYAPGSLPPSKHVTAPGACQKPSQNVTKPNVPKPDVGAGAGRQSAGITAAPKRGRGLLNAAALPGSRVPLCGHCHGQIRGPFITALGKIWCPQHFICATPSCRRHLQDLGFVEENGQLYCEYCFEQYLAPPCSKCQGKIKGDCLKAIGKNFHPECFNCVYCGKLFGNSPFFLEDGNPYCDADWNELFTTKCYACGFPVEAGDRWVEALNNNYHSQCFNCTMCKKNLEGQSFFAKGGRPFCKNHAR